jgi:hypothetical protein
LAVANADVQIASSGTSSPRKSCQFPALSNGPAWIRTRDQRIMSPLL